MNLLLVLVLSSAAHSSALGDWWRGFCERHLVADNPWPFAEESNQWLIEHGYDAEARKELRYRVSAGMLGARHARLALELLERE